MRHSDLCHHCVISQISDLSPLGILTRYDGLDWIPSQNVRGSPSHRSADLRPWKAWGQEGKMRRPPGSVRREVFNSTVCSHSEVGFRSAVWNLGDRNPQEVGFPWGLRSSKSQGL